MIGWQRLILALVGYLGAPLGTLMYFFGVAKVAVYAMLAAGAVGALFAFVFLMSGELFNWIAAGFETDKKVRIIKSRQTAKIAGAISIPETTGGELSVRRE